MPRQMAAGLEASGKNEHLEPVRNYEENFGVNFQELRGAHLERNSLKVWYR